MNIFAKTKPWMVASLCAATSLFAQDAAPAAPAKCRPQKSFEQGHELAQGQLMAAYNATARIDVRGSWDFYVTGSFIYWQPQQENMELGIAVNTQSVGLIPGAPSTALNTGNFINADFSYKPGFKVGLGMNFEYDNWDAYAEYTWFHGTHTTSSNGPQGGGIFALMGHPGLPLTNNNLYTSAANSWKLKMDFADLNLGRAYYVGTKLSFRPAVGARGAWIRENSVYTYINDGTTTFTGATSGTLSVTDRSISWGVGPSVSMDSNWMLGYGLRVFGRGEADLLYTRYNVSSYQSFSTLANVLVTQFNTKQHHIDYLRPHMDLELGLGWGSYFDNNNWHIDLAASYGFQVFWDQNMIRHYYNSTFPQYSNAPNGNLYIHGLTATVKLDF